MDRKNLGEEIYSDIERKILSGKYQLGEKLPSERKLAEIYMTSRVPVRDALKLLVKHGYVETKQGSGTIIISQGLTILDSLLSEDNHKITNKNLFLETIQVRCLIEAKAAEIAAEKRTENDIKDIQSALFNSINEIRKLKLGEKNSFFTSDLYFHRTIVKASGNDFLLQCFDSMLQLISYHQFWSLKYTTPRDDVVAYHTSIYEAIIVQNSTKAYNAMFDHLSHVKSLIMSESSDPDDPSNYD